MRLLGIVASVGLLAACGGTRQRESAPPPAAAAPVELCRQRISTEPRTARSSTLIREAERQLAERNAAAAVGPARRALAEAPNADAHAMMSLVLEANGDLDGARSARACMLAALAALTTGEGSARAPLAPEVPELVTGELRGAVLSADGHVWWSLDDIGTLRATDLYERETRLPALQSGAAQTWTSLAADARGTEAFAARVGAIDVVSLAERRVVRTMAVDDRDAHVGQLALSEDGTRLAAVVDFRTVVVIDARTGRRLEEHRQPSGHEAVTALTFAGETLVYATEQGAVFAADRPLAKHANGVHVLAARGDRVVSCVDETCQSYTLAAPAPRTVKLPVQVSSVALDAHGVPIAIGTDGSLLRWDTDTPAVRPVATSAGQLAFVRFSSVDERHAVITRSTGFQTTSSVELVDVATARTVATMAMGSAVRRVAFSFDGRMLAMSTESPVPVVFLGDVEAHGRFVESANPSMLGFDDAGNVVVGGRRGVVAWDPLTGRQSWTAEGERALATARTRVAIARDDGLLLGGPDGKIAHRLSEGPGAVELSFGAADTRLFARREGVVTGWDTSGESPRALGSFGELSRRWGRLLSPGPNLPVPAVSGVLDLAAARDVDVVVAAFESGHLSWGTSAAFPSPRVSAVPIPGVDVVDVAVTPDGNTAALADGHSSTGIQLVRRGASKGVTLPHPGGANAVAFSPNGRLLASGGRDGSIRLFDVASGRLVATVLAVPHAAVETISAPTFDLVPRDVNVRRRMIWVVFTPDGRVDGSPDAASLLTWRVGNARLPGAAAWPMQMQSGLLGAVLAGH